MLDVYKSLPCYKDVKVDAEDKGTVQITTFDGKTCNVGLLPLLGRQVDMRKPAVLERANAAREDYEHRLELGDYYMFFRRGGLITGGASGAEEILPPLVKTLRSTKDEATKLEEIRQGGLRGVTEDACAEIVRHFSASPQLEQRLAELTAQKKRR
jgi:hypothetical protein